MPRGRRRTIVSVLDETVVRQARIEVRHQRRDVLRGGQPAVNVFAGVEEAAGGDGDVADFVAIEREVELQFDGLRERGRK